MFFTFLSWIVIGLSAWLWGMAFRKAMNRLTGSSYASLLCDVMLGLCALAVFAEFFSLFFRVGSAALAVVILADLVIAFLERQFFRTYLMKLLDSLLPWKALLILASLILVLPQASSYILNGDTDLYHAQAIRWIEEYGVVKGLGNLHSRLAFDSSFLCLQALFSFRDIAGQSMHSVNGFIAFSVLAWSFCSFRSFRKKQVFVSDFLRVAAIYVVSSLSYDFSSPGTDLFAHLLTVYIFTEWISLLEDGIEDPSPYALLSVLAVFAFTLKLSAAVNVLLVVLPAVMLIKSKNWKAILGFMCAGIIVLLPHLARSVIISGYLVYPMESIDLFPVKWKMLPRVCQYERLRTKAWAEEIFGVADFSSPLSVWFPYWRAAQDPSVLRLLLLDAVSCVLLLCAGISRFFRKKTWSALHVSLVVSACFVYWFFSAPNVRFGRPVITIPVFLALGFICAVIFNRISSSHAVASRLAAAVCILTLCVSPLSSLFTSARAADRFFFRPADYEEHRVISCLIGEEEFYIPAQDNLSGYHVFPSVLNQSSADDVELLGDSIADGFRLK